MLHCFMVVFLLWFFGLVTNILLSLIDQSGRFETLMLSCAEWGLIICRWMDGWMDGGFENNDFPFHPIKKSLIVAM